MHCSLNEEECFIIRNALQTYADELKKTLKAEEKVNVPSTAVQDRIATIFGRDDKPSLIAKFHDQSDMFAEAEIMTPEPTPKAAREDAEVVVEAEPEVVQPTGPSAYEDLEDAQAPEEIEAVYAISSGPRRLSAGG